MERAKRNTDAAAPRSGSLPGPGDYHKETKRGGRSYTMRPKVLPKDRTLTLPGPGAYSPVSKEKNPGGCTKILPGKFKTLEHGPSFEEVPGPGSYESGVKTDKAGPQYGFGSEKRLAEPQKTT